jgi:hypothetical protein
MPAKSAARIVKDELKEHAQQMYGRDLVDYRREARLVEDLGFDDVDLADIGDALRKKLHVALPVPLTARTLGELIDACRRLTNTDGAK